MFPTLYSFRRCPFAIRARMALCYSAQTVELREVFLQSKPPALLSASPKGTVPVLVLPAGKVLEESIDIMRWALNQQDTDLWWREESSNESLSLVNENDFGFKTHLDHYKYPERFPAHSQTQYRAEAELFLKQLEQKLAHRPYLLDDELSVADVAIFPFIRQFAFVDKPWFDQAPYPKLQLWLQSFLESPLFSKVMTKFPAWQEGDVPIIFPHERDV